MYDYIKIDVNDKGLEERLMHNPVLNFTTMVNEKSGEIKDGVNVAEYKNLVFTIFPSGRIEIKGSLHKFWNDGLHNWNDFTLADVRDTIDALQATFGIDPIKATIHNLEFGVNVHTPFSPNDLLTSLIVHKQEPFNKMTTRGQGHGKEVYYQRYGVKIYNKGLQYNRPNHILRFEKKVKKMECIGLGIIRLKDLGDKDLFTLLWGQLVDCFDEVILTDKVNRQKLTKPEQRLFDKCRNPLEWGIMTKQKRSSNKVKFNQIISTYGTHKYHTVVRDLLVKSGDLLTDISNTKRLPINRSISRLERHFLPSDILQINPFHNEPA